MNFYYRGYTIVNEFKDIDFFVKQRMNIEGEISSEGEYWIDTMLWAVKLSRLNKCVCPADIYIALLESGDVKHYSWGNFSTPYNNCVMYMSLVIPLGFFTCTVDVIENGNYVVTEHTIFYPVFNERFTHFVELLEERKRWILTHRYSPIHSTIDWTEPQKYKDDCNKADDLQTIWSKQSEWISKNSAVRRYTKRNIQVSKRVKEIQQTIKATEPIDQETTKTTKKAKIEANHKRWKSQQAQKRGEIIQEQIDPDIAAQRAKWREQKQKQREKKQHLPPVSQSVGDSSMAV